MNKHWRYGCKWLANTRVGMLLAVVAICFSTSANAASVLQMNLQQLCDRAGKIFSGTVLSVEASTVAAGGGQMPVLQYRVRVDEGFKGQFAQEKGVEYVEFRMLGTLAQLKAGHNGIMPVLQQGKPYLLMLAPDGPLGVTSTIGLVQGTFSLSTDRPSMALNGANNVGLFNGMNGFSANFEGPVSYEFLADTIRNGLEAN